MIEKCFAAWLVSDILLCIMIVFRANVLYITYYCFLWDTCKPKGFYEHFIKAAAAISEPFRFISPVPHLFNGSACCPFTPSMFQLKPAAWTQTHHRHISALPSSTQAPFIFPGEHGSGCMLQSWQGAPVGLKGMKVAFSLNITFSGPKERNHSCILNGFDSLQDGET